MVPQATIVKVQRVQTDTRFTRLLKEVKRAIIAAGIRHRNFKDCPRMQESDKTGHELDSMP